MSFWKELGLKIIFWCMILLSVFKLVDAQKWLGKIGVLNFLWDSWVYQYFLSHGFFFFLGWFFLVIISYRGFPTGQKFINIVKPKAK